MLGATTQPRRDRPVTDDFGAPLLLSRVERDRPVTSDLGSGAASASVSGGGGGATVSQMCTQPVNKTNSHSPLWRLDPGLDQTPDLTCISLSINYYERSAKRGASSYLNNGQKSV